MIRKLEGTCLKLSKKYPGLAPRTRTDDFVLGAVKYLKNLPEQIREELTYRREANSLASGVAF
jgi:hypothetical protein